MRVDLHRLVGLLAGIEGVEDLTVTTNGYLLAQQAQQLKDAGLNRITVSLDSLDDDIFKKMNGRGLGVRRVLEGIERAAAVGLSPIKINAVVQKGVNDGAIVDLARYFKGTGHIVRFIEYMDVGNRNRWNLDDVVPAAEIIRRINAEMPLESLESGYRGEVATRYRYRDGDGEVGIIASVSQPFCGDCIRSRLSTDGMMYACLFAGLGVSLREPMRAGATDGDLRDLIARIWGSRDARYSEERTELADPQTAPRKIEMYQIGG